MSLNKLMETLTESLFVSTSKFGETVDMYLNGSSTAVQVNVVWGADTTPGTNEIDGDGVVLDRRTGRKVRESIDVELSADVEIDENAKVPTCFVRGDECATVKRIVGYDSGGMQTVRCVVTKWKFDRGARRLG